MEARPTRRSLRSFPPQLEFTQDPQDDLRKFLDIQGRQFQLANEYIRDQTNNLWLPLADPNEPAHAFTSGIDLSETAEISGGLVQNLQDLTTQEVTDFEYQETIIPSGLPNEFILGISYAQDAPASGYLYLTTSGYWASYRYDWLDFENPVSGTLGVQIQDFVNLQADEFLSIEGAGREGAFARLRHTPRDGKVRLIDSKNLQHPWDPESNGIEVDESDYLVSGNVLHLHVPRASYVPAGTSGNSLIYPTDYQPDYAWDSSFIAEYEYNLTDAPYGLSQEDIRHHMGLVGRPLWAGKEL